MARKRKPRHKRRDRKPRKDLLDDWGHLFAEFPPRGTAQIMGLCPWCGVVGNAAMLWFDEESEMMPSFDGSRPPAPGFPVKNVWWFWWTCCEKHLGAAFVDTHNVPGLEFTGFEFLDA
jgi:hypothetical protein